MSKYRDRTGTEVVTNDGKEPPPPPQPCHRCGTMTLYATLAQYGAMCLGCFGRYCVEPQPASAWMADKRTDGDRAWAYALQAREEAGDRLTPAQKAMWRDAVQWVRIETDKREAA